MATSAPPDEEVVALEVRKAAAWLRKIMYETARVHLSTSAENGGRWLTDEYVCLDATGSPAVEGLEDGAYKLTAGRGLVRLMLKHADAGEVPCLSGLDVDAYAQVLADADWQPATPSEWSVAEHPGKAMLFTVRGGHPALLGEETWSALRKQFDGACAEYAMHGRLNVFRILAVLHDGCDTDDEDVYCGCRPVVVAYVAGIRVPDGQDGIAAAIAMRAVPGPKLACLPALDEAEWTTLDEAA